MLPSRRRASAGARRPATATSSSTSSRTSRPAHVLLVRLLAAPALDVFGVGDDDQVIYGHAGADPAFLIDFDQLFPGAAVPPARGQLPLPGRRSSTPPGTCSATTDRRVAKEIRPGPDADAAADALVVRRHRPEAGRGRAGRRSSGLAEPTAPAPADIAVLTRVNSLLLAPHVALVEAGVPVSSTCRPTCSTAPACGPPSPTSASAPTPTASQPDDLHEVLRRPSRGFPSGSPSGCAAPMSHRRAARLADRIDDAKVGAKVAGLADDLAAVADAVRTGTTRDGARGHRRRGRPRRRHVAARHARRAARRARSSTTSTPWPRWPTSTPTRRRSSAGCAAVLQRKPPTTAASRCRPCTG